MNDISHSILFEGLSEAQVASLMTLSSEHAYDDPEVFIKKGEVHDFIAVLIDGNLRVFDQSENDEFVVASLTKVGDLVGGQSLLRRPASMNVEAGRKTSILVFPIDKIKTFPELYEHLLINSAVDTAKKLETTNQELIGLLKKAITASATIVLCLSGISIGMFFLSFMASIQYPTDSLWSWLFILFVIPPPLIFIASTRQPLSNFGVTLSNLNRSIQDGVFGSAALIIGLFVLIQSLKNFTQISVGDVVGYMNLSSPLSYIYLFHCYLQEFFVRGAIQSSLLNVIQNSMRSTLSVVLASAIFAVLHYPLGFMPIVATFLSGLLFGYIYNRTKNLVGVTLIHYLSGKVFFGFYFAFQALQ